MFSEVSLPIAFLAGLLSFFSPCILPILPPYLSFITGVSVEELLRSEDQRHQARYLRRTFSPTLFFTLGFTLVFMGMGATATAAGRFILGHSGILRWVGGILVILFGLHFLGILRIPILYREKRLHPKAKPAHIFGALLVGMAFAVGWTPCIGPILGSILAYAGTQENVSHGMALLGGYSFGLAVPFLMTGIATGYSFRLFKRIRKFLPLLSIGSGILLILVGILILTDNLNIIGQF